MIVIPKQDLPQDVEYYKEQLTGNALLEQAGHLAAKKKRFLQDKTLTDDQIVRKIKPLSGKLRHTNKRLRGLPIGGAGESAGDDEGLVTTALEKWMNKVTKKHGGVSKINAATTASRVTQDTPIESYSGGGAN